MAENIPKNKFQYSKMSCTAIFLYALYFTIDFKRCEAEKQIQAIRFILCINQAVKNW